MKHEVLNAKNHAREAAIVAQAGRLGAVTVATNMAGRGTDVMLGGNAEFLAVAEMNNQGLSPVDTPDEYEAEWDTVYAAVKAEVQAEADKVVEVGGLYVLGTERHESRRIDNQLRGRSGRQGDPGESRFYLSLQDDLMRLFNSGAAEALMGRSNVPDDLAIESKIVSRAIRSAQSQVEGRNAEIRKNVLKYDDVLNRQREAIYGDRRHILEGDDLQDRVARLPRRRHQRGRRRAHRRGPQRRLGLRRAVDRAQDALPDLDHGRRGAHRGGSARQGHRRVPARRRSSPTRSSPTSSREQQLGEPAMRELERRVVLSVIDRRWRDHLYEMDYLKDGIGLRAMAQRDPLVEYQREGFALYQQMMGRFARSPSASCSTSRSRSPAAPTVDGPRPAQPAAAGERAELLGPERGRRGRGRGAQPARPARAGRDRRAQQAQQAQAAQADAAFRQQQPQQPQQAPAAQQGGQATGAFGQKTGPQAPPSRPAEPCPASRAGEAQGSSCFTRAGIRVARG